MRARLTLLILASALLTGTAPAQQDLMEKARLVLTNIGLEEEWVPDELASEETGYGAVRIKSKRMTLFFGGPEMRFLSFIWHEKVDELRARRTGKGAYYSEPGDAARKAMELVRSLVPDPERWRPLEEIDLNHPMDGKQMEFQGGAITTKLEHFVDGLVAVGDSISATFDTMDGKVAMLFVGFRSQTTFTDRTNVMQPAQAEQVARSHAVQFLRRTMGEQRASEYTNAFWPPGQTSVTLAYGPTGRGFDSKFRDYTTRRLVPPVYKVDFGNVQLWIHAKTGECLGGYRDDQISDGSNRKTPSGGSTPPATANASGRGTGSSDDLNEPEASSGSPFALVLSSVLGVAVIGVGVALYLRYSR